MGAGDDYAVQMPGTLPITWAEGQFAGVTVGSESDGAANSYSLQLNSNYFPNTQCGSNSNCYAWQQYVYGNNPGNSTGTLYMQYWLVNLSSQSQCPGGFTFFAGAAGQAAGCYMNSAAIEAPLQAITNLGELALGGYATSGGDDEAQLYDNGSIYSTSGPDSVLSLGVGDTWTSAEFNVVGLNDGSEATFSSGTLLTVNTLVSNGQASTTPVPNCLSNAGTTAETNNLSLSSVCCPYPASNYGSAYPYIYFQEAYGFTLPTSCPLPVPNVTVSGGTYTAANVWQFSFSWPSVSGATYYNMSVNGAAQSITGNTSSVGIGCGHTDVVTFSSCNASGCGLTEEVLDAHNTKSCGTN